MNSESITRTETLNPNSVEIGRSAAGKVTITVKAYAETCMDAYRNAKEVFDLACNENPA